MADDVRLTDLEVIQRYSIAVRGETAARDELLEALRADLAWLERGGRPKATKPAAKPAVSEPAEPAESAEPAEPARKPAARAAKPAAKPASKPAKAAKATRR